MKHSRWHKGLWAWCFSVLAIPAWSQQPPGVQLGEVTRSDIIEEVRLNGTVNALRSGRISTAVAGLVDDVRVDAGTDVDRGDLLIGLDDEQARFELASARADTQQARARLDEARRRLEEAQSVGAGVNIAATEVRARESEVALAKAAVSRLQALESRQQVILRRHRVEAPFAGTVSVRSSDLGEWVTPGDELLTLVDTNSLRLDFRVPQEYYWKIGDDTELLVRHSGGEGQAVTAKIADLVPVSDPQSRTFLLRAPSPDDFPALPGIAVQAVLRVSTGREGLTVSRDAINRYPEGRTTVWIARPADEGRFTVHEQRVHTGISFDNRVVVTEGLEGGEQVVVRGNEALENDMTVRLAEREAR